MSKLKSKHKSTIFKLLSIVLFSWISFLALSSSIENEEIRFSKRDLYDGWGDLEWSPCGEFECATISVNFRLSLTNEKINISLIKYSPDNKRKSRNYLIINPGNRSGISVVKSSGRDISKLFDNRYDIIGFDPRGIGSSNPIICSTESQSFPYMKVFGATFLPKDATLIQAINYDSTSKLHAQICENSSDDVIRNNGMIFIARDLEQIRIALGTRKLNYWGIGYGALAGLEYSKEFPKNIGNMILDSPPSPTTYHEYYRGDILSHIFSLTANVESSLSLIAKQCDHSNNCPLSRRNKSSLLALESVINNLRVNPQMIDDEKGGILTVERVEQLIYYSLAKPYEWYGIAVAFDQATQGNFKLLFELYQKLKMPTTKELFLLNAPICNDSFVKPLSVEEWMERISEMEKTNSFAARILGSHIMQCRHWPKFKFTGSKVKSWNKKLKQRLLIVSNQVDPTVSFNGASDVMTLISKKNGVLLKQNGVGHGVLSQPNNCILRAMKDYMLRGILPDESTVCNVEHPIFPDTDIHKTEEIVAAERIHKNLF